MFKRFLLAACFTAGIAITSVSQCTWAIETAVPMNTAASSPSENDDKLSPADVEFFERKIRPVLVERCYQCHSTKSDKIRGGLLLDTRAGLLAGGDNGPSVVPGDVDGSPIIQAIRYTKKDYAMPPEKSGGKLSDVVIRDFEEWVKRGAPDPRRGSSSKIARKDISAEARKWWAYQPLQQPTAPILKNGSWAYSDLDRYILATLEAKKLAPVADTDPVTLLRRVCYNLTGLPPTIDQQQRFLTNWNKHDHQKVYTQFVDELLASPRFGEHWGRYWLDVARYAESCGKDVNIAYPHAWRYRDYVIQAINNDKPYDRFLKEQLAGDLLNSKNDQEKAQQLIATGFLALGPKSINEQNPLQFAVDQADEMIDTVSQAFMGITVSCARCHDHKFDPIPQKDYTAWAGIFLSTDVRFGTSGGVQARNASPLIELPAKATVPIVAKGMTKDERKKAETKVKELREEFEKAFANRNNAKNDAGFNIVRISTQLARFQNEINSTNEDGSPKALAMGAMDKPATTSLFARNNNRQEGPYGRLNRRAAFATITDSPLYARGEVSKPTENVARGTLGFFTSNPIKIGKGESGRKQLADWIVEQPLTVRVMTNRVWHWLFGKGLVTSVDNFGMTGDTPSHPELLEHLSLQFKKDGWSIKKLVRSIVLSHTYQLSSAQDAKAMEIDPDNKYLWRHTPRRLTAESIRDSMLAASGQLDLTPHQGSLIARSGDGPIGGPRFMSISEGQLASADGSYRSVYLPVARNAVPLTLHTFDFPDGDVVQGAREITNVPGQALFLLNSEFVKQQAEKLAMSIVTKYPGNGLDKFNDRFTLATKLVYGREPKPAESELARNYLVKLGANTSRDKAKTAWISLCRSLFASAEFRMVD